jgi:hypothetical protein
MLDSVWGGIQPEKVDLKTIELSLIWIKFPSLIRTLSLLLKCHHRLLPARRVIAIMLSLREPRRALEASITDFLVVESALASRLLLFLFDLSYNATALCFASRARQSLTKMFDILFVYEAIHGNLRKTRMPLRENAALKHRNVRRVMVRNNSDLFSFGAGQSLSGS